MKTENFGVTIEIMGRAYKIKCLESEVESLQEAARYFEEKMRALRDSGQVLSIDRIVLITALNITHDYLSLDNQIQHRLCDLQDKITHSLAEHLVTESSSAK